jgi:hypothetical protein
MGDASNTPSSGMASHRRLVLNTHFILTPLIDTDRGRRQRNEIRATFRNERTRVNAVKMSEKVPPGSVPLESGM